MKILIYDDNTDYLWLFAKWLRAKRPEFYLISCRSEFELFEEAKKGQPDIIFVDVFLPERNGFQIVRDLRKLKNLRDTKIYLLTAIGGEVEIDCKKAQIDGFVTKTMGFNHLVGILEGKSYENFKFPEPKFAQRQEDRYDRYPCDSGAVAR